jgi:hypothetical protein
MLCTLLTLLKVNSFCGIYRGISILFLRFVASTSGDTLTFGSANLNPTTLGGGFGTGKSTIFLGGAC